VSTHSGWIEWGYQKLNIRSLRHADSLTASAIDFLLWHHFGKNQEHRNHDLVKVYRQYFHDKMNPHNLAMLLDTYITRSDLNIQRLNVQSGSPPGKGTLSMPVLLITGSYSPHVDDTGWKIHLQMQRRNCWRLYLSLSHSRGLFSQISKYLIVFVHRV
jgi:hypothetical protein